MKSKEDFAKYALYKLISDKDANDIYKIPKHTVQEKKEFTSGIDFSSLNYNPLTDPVVNERKRRKEINEWREKSKAINLNKSNVKYIKTESEENKKYLSTITNLVVYFQVNEVEYYFKLIDVDTVSGRWVASSITTPTNKGEQDEIEKQRRVIESKKNYKPKGLEITYYNWSYKDNPKTFSEFYVTIKNSTPYDFKKISFKLVIVSSNQNPKIDIFNRTIEEYIQIYAGDAVRIKINELNNYYTGVDISNEKNFKIYTFLLDAKPNPEYEDLPY
jgi:hypothetical protein